MTMKKIVFICLFLFLYTFTSFSQESSAKKYKAGFMGGIGGCQVDGDTYSGYRKLGFSFGSFVNLTLKDIHTIQMELAYMQRGSQHNPNYAKDDMNIYRLVLNCMDLSLIYSNWFFKAVALEGGFTGTYLINAREFVQGTEQDPDPAFRDFGLGITGGFKYHLNKHFDLGVRMSYSLVPLREFAVSGNTRAFGQEGQFSNTIMFNIAYAF